MAHKLKTIRILLIIAVFALLGVSAWLAIDIYRFAHHAPGSDSSPKRFSISQGEGFNQLAHRLNAIGMISSPIRFKLLARLKKEDKQLKAGEYRLSANMSPNQILEVLVSGKQHLYRITIPEGFNMQQIADEINRLKLTDGDQFLLSANNAELASKLSITALNFEGYLFPDTYYFPKKR